jgi:hypothetical protein
LTAVDQDKALVVFNQCIAAPCHEVVGSYEGDLRLAFGEFEVR